MNAPDLSRVETARAVARRFKVSPQHSLGQNFLVDDGVRQRIVASLGVDSGPLLEIGCGLGALSQALLAKGWPLTGLELDESCVAALRLLQAEHPDFRVIHMDALSADPVQLGFSGRYSVVANLPYQITGAILPHLLRWDPAPLACHLVVQREVARRLAAPLGDWSLATLSLRMAAEVESVFDIAPESFWPQPKVHSSLVVVRPHGGSQRNQEEGILKLARPIFQQRRKQRHHGLAKSIGVGAGRAAQLLVEAGLDPSRRPGTLSPLEWRDLWDVVSRDPVG